MIGITRAGWAIAPLATFMVASPASAQCESSWLHARQQVLPGVDGSAVFLSHWDADGPGPIPDSLVVAGGFTIAGTARANSIALWDGMTWSTLGEGLPGPAVYGVVRATEEFMGQLFAVGSFRRSYGAAADYLAQWDGDTWQPVGAGLSYTPAQGGFASALVEYNDRLVVAGRFMSAGGIPVGNIAAWDGSSWHALGTGLDGNVNDLVVFRGQLVALGDFNAAGGVPSRGIACWDGEAWHAAGAALDGGVRCAVVGGDDLVVSGGFTTTGNVLANHVAAWNGDTWRPFGTGLNDEAADLVLFAGDIVAGGVFPAPDGKHTTVWRWTGSDWEDMSGTTSGPLNTVVFGLYVWNESLFAAGTFADSGLSVARWDGAAWRPLADGLNRRVRAAAQYDGELVLGGEFTVADRTDAGRIVSWRGDSWRPLGPGIPGVFSGRTINALVAFQSDLIAGGSFSAAGTIAAQNIASWNGSEWRPLGPGMNGTINALAVYNGELIAAGFFSTAGGVAAANIARWNGLQWGALGAGTSDTIYALQVYDGKLIAAGRFMTAGGMTAARIAVWDGTTWSAMGAGFDNQVFSLTLFEQDLIATGKFTTSGSTSVSRISRWNGTAWQALGAGLNADVTKACVYRGELVAGGSFSIGPVNRLAKWDGTSWQPLSLGLDWSPSVLMEHNGELVVGGQIVDIVGDTPSAYWARWSEQPRPWIAVHPQDATVSCATAGSASFAIIPASGYGNLLFQWRRELSPGQFVPLADGPTESGAFIAGASTATLTITDASSGDAGRYDCTVSNSCGGSTSHPAALIVCVADLNCDGITDFTDYLEFLNLYEAFDPRADLTGDDVIDFGDYLEFLNHYDAGC